MNKHLKNSMICLLLLMGTCRVLLAEVPLVILHTNDIHSQLEPFPSTDPQRANKAGMLRWEALCSQVRKDEPHVLVFFSGDIFQGTPYFNFFKGEAEIAMLNAINPTAITLGNHEFDNGVDLLATALNSAKFPVVCTNYQVTGTPLSSLIKPWLVVRSGPLRIGVVSANLNLEGKIDKSKLKGVAYVDPIKAVEETALWLRETKKCDVVICLSHLGHETRGEAPDDLKLAAKTRSIDVILGGHSHTFLKEPVVVKNLDGEDVIINQCGKSGVYVGRLDLLVDH